MNEKDGWRAILFRLLTASRSERLFISLAALTVSIILGAILVVFSGYFATCRQPSFTIVGATFCYNPIEVYYYLFIGAFNESFNLALTLRETTLLLFTGLSVAIAFRAGMFNIGSQGQLIMGSLAAALTVLFAVSFVPGGIIGSLILIPLGLVIGAVAGGIYGAIPGALKAYSEANEVITTIMLNFVAIKLAFVIVSENFVDPTSDAIETRSLPGYATLDSVFFREGSEFSVIALLFGLALVVVLYVLLERTVFGYDLQTSGLQPRAAEYSGTDAEMTMVTSMTLSGAIAGIGGAIWVFMVMGGWRVGVPSLGFDGITVSILAGNNPFGVVPAALLFGMLKSGSQVVNFATGVPTQLVGVLRGLIILFVAMPVLFRMLGRQVLSIEDRTKAVADGGEDVE